MRRTMIALILGGLMTTGCGESDQDVCEKTGRLLCERACACSQEGCAVTTLSEGGISVSLTFDSEDKCTGLYVSLGCAGGGNAEIDHQACYDALQDSQCSGTEPGAGVVLPAACTSGDKL